MRPYEIGCILENDTLVVTNIRTLHEIFDVNSAQVTHAINLVTLGIRSSSEHIGELISIWKSRRPQNQCTGRHLLCILRNAEYISAVGTKTRYFALVNVKSMKNY